MLAPPFTDPASNSLFTETLTALAPAFDKLTDPATRQPAAICAFVASSQFVVYQKLLKQTDGEEAGEKPDLNKLAPNLIRTSDNILKCLSAFQKNVPKQPEPQPLSAQEECYALSEHYAPHLDRIHAFFNQLDEEIHGRDPGYYAGLRTDDPRYRPLPDHEPEPDPPADTPGSPGPLPEATPSIDPAASPDTAAPKASQDPPPPPPRSPARKRAQGIKFTLPKPTATPAAPDAPPPPVPASRGST